MVGLRPEQFAERVPRAGGRGGGMSASLAVVLCRLLCVSSTRVDRLLRLAFMEYIHYFIESPFILFTERVRVVG